MVQAILFDFWGTIVENGVWSPTKQVQNILRVQIPFSEFVTRMEKVLMSSNHQSLPEAFSVLCREFNITPKPHILDELVGMWNKNWMLAKPFEEAMTQLPLLQKEFTLVLYCNTDPFSVKGVLEKFKMDKYFTKIFFSCEMGKIKTDPLFFDSICQQLKLPKEECVIIGDSIDSDIIPAKKSGMAAILLDRRGMRDYTPKITSLAEVSKVLL